MALSLDLRERIIKAYENEEGSIRQVGKRFAVGSASIWRLLKRHQNKEELAPTSPPGRTPLIDEKGLKIIAQ